MSRVLDQAFDDPLTSEEEAALPLAGGILQYGHQCGMIWGAVLSAGRQAYVRHDATARAEAQAVVTAKRLVNSFRSLNTHVNCVDITELDKTSTSMQMLTFFLLKGGFVSCCRRVAKYASAALGDIESGMTHGSDRPPAEPVSCATMLARTMDASDMHAVMVAGFAGGLGLSGGGCGALGAALWILGLRVCQDRTAKLDYQDTHMTDTLEKFLKHTGCSFECSEIAGRRFESLDEHAAYLQGGGCADLIELLASV